MRIIGIDPGISGGIACIFEAGGVPVSCKMPETEHDIDAVFKGLACSDIMAFIEAVHSMPGQGVASTFKFGRNYGFLRGVLVALSIPFEEVRPQVWQKALGCLSRGDKNVTKAAAQRLWPSIKWTHATADAALIAEYGRREMARRTKK